jgi:hypothetical protein
MGALPETVALKIAVLLIAFVTLCGWAVITGATAAVPFVAGTTAETARKARVRIFMQTGLGERAEWGVFIVIVI